MKYVYSIEKKVIDLPKGQKSEVVKNLFYRKERGCTYKLFNTEKEAREYFNSIVINDHIKPESSGFGKCAIKCYQLNKYLVDDDNDVHYLAELDFKNDVRLLEINLLKQKDKAKIIAKVINEGYFDYYDKMVYKETRRSYFGKTGDEVKERRYTLSELNQLYESFKVHHGQDCFEYTKEYMESEGY